jgi:hypothetical protein
MAQTGGEKGNRTEREPAANKSESASVLIWAATLRPSDDSE